MTSVLARPMFYTRKQQVPQLPGTTLGFMTGRGYYAKPVVVAPPPAGRVSPSGFQVGATPPEDPYLAQAKAIAAAMLDPQEAAAQRAILQANQDSIGRAKAYEGATNAFASMTKDLPEAVRAAYSAAGHDISGYASGVTGEAGAADQAAAAEIASRLAAVGAPGSVEADPNYQRTVMQVGGFIPARTMSERAASEFAQMAGLRTAGGASMAQAATEQAARDAASIADLRQKAVDLEGTRAGEIAKALLQLHDEARQQQSVDIQNRALQVQQGQLQLSQAKTDIDRAEAMTNITGTLWVVRNGKVVNTGQAAPGSAGYKQTHPATPAPAHLQSGMIGTHAVTFDPNTGARYYPGTKTLIPQSVLDQWSKEAATAKNKPKPPGPVSLQSKTLPDGTVVNYNPRTGKYTDPVTGAVVDTSKHGKPTKGVDAKTKMRARNGIAAALAQDKKTRPAAIYASGVANGIPSWVMVNALRQEAANHPDDPAWQNVLKPGWASGA